MLYLIHQQIAWLLLTAAAAGVAGWAWYKMRRGGRAAALDAQREALRRELVGLVNGTAEDGAEDLWREIDSLRARGALREAKIAELERRLEEARAAREELAAQLAEKERGAVEAAHTPAPPDHAHWRTRYLEARVRHLEGRLEEPSLRAERDAALARIAELEGALEAMGAVKDDELNRLRWQARYLDARVRYLERPEPTPAPAAEEDIKRRAWRLRYLEARVAHLEREVERWRSRAQQSAAQCAAAEEVSLVRAVRIAELEPLAPQAELAQRLAWRARYLEARLRHIESRAAEPAPPAAPVVEEEAGAPPLVPPGAEERPPALPAARFGAPDDLTLIAGVTPMQQSTLHALGVFHFDQLGAWTPANVAWVDQYLRLRGRIVEERWVEQAAALARGERVRAKADA